MKIQREKMKKEVQDEMRWEWRCVCNIIKNGEEEEEAIICFLVRGLPPKVQPPFLLTFITTYEILALSYMPILAHFNLSVKKYFFYTVSIFYATWLIQMSFDQFIQHYCSKLSTFNSTVFIVAYAWVYTSISISCDETNPVDLVHSS